MGVTIGQYEVGLGRPVYVVAEAGVNHDGDVDQARRLIDAARQAGADAVKFQYYTPSELAARHAGTANYQKRFAGENQLAMLERLALGPRGFAIVAEHCRRVGLPFLATPFSLPDLQALLELQPVALKLASTDLNNSLLIQAAADSGLPLIMSTGASTELEIARAISWLKISQAAERAVFLHCVSCYPTAERDANILRMVTLAHNFRVPVGYSDHTLSEETGALAVAAGACLIEKHITLDRTQPGPDHACSLEPEAMRRYIAAVRRAEVLCGDGRIDCRPCEDDVRTKSRKSVVARRAIAAGERLNREMLTVKRPGGGLEPWQLESLLGRVVRQDIPVDGQITWEMVE